MAPGTTKATKKHPRSDGDGNNSLKKKAVLKKATLRAADYLGLSNVELSEVLKVSESTVSRLKKQDDYYLNLDSNEADKALFLVRIYQSLFALIGDDKEQIQDWLHSQNTYLNTTPLLAMKTTAGVVNVTGYLDAMRG